MILIPHPINPLARLVSDGDIAQTATQAEAVALRHMDRVAMLCGVLHGKPSNGNVDSWAAFSTVSEWVTWRQQFAQE